ncbi:MAG TPA: PQQ-binding-like beta-propeller repeat protein [Steroidobacteraceae bacterium]|jgi:polyvinyl alcohol dehydrogenase (cytochrome)|nr:PQQ-binding-like beta-propeller repeat protein [Steroidobacteraceae bacterium]
MPATVHAWLCAAFVLLLMGPLTSAAADAAPPALVPERNSCVTRADPVATGSAQWNGWGKDLDNTRYQPEPAIRATDVAKLGLKWTFGYQSGTEFGQPTVVDGRLFVSSSAGRIYALDSKTGCTYWTYDAAAGSRTAIFIGELGQSKRAVLPKKLKRTLAHLDVIKAPSAAFFGDDSGAVYALDAQKGTLLWKSQVDTHPLARIVGAPTLYNDRLYVVTASSEDKMAGSPGYGCCTFRGSVAALDIGSGRLVWKSYTVLEEPQPTRKNSAGVQEFGPAGAAIVAAPTVDPKRNVLYVATGGSATGFEQSLTDAVAAFDLSDGKLRWVKQLSVKGEVASSGFMGSAILRTLSTGNQIILAGQLSGVVYGLDPDHGGEILWQTRVAASGSTAAAATAPGAAANSGDGGIAWGGSADHRNFYVALSGLAAQPANAGGSLTALDMKTGVVRWTTPAPQPACAWTGDCSHAQAQAVTVMPGVAFSGSMDGHLRAYSTIDGKILWDFDTAKAFQTQNGVRASGGPLDRGGATVVNGSVYINSGNALLAFSVDAK